MRDGWQSWGANDIDVSEEEFLSYEYRSAGMLCGTGRGGNGGSPEA